MHHNKQQHNKMNTITTTNFNFTGQKSVYRGKVREVYNINDDLLVMIATDRLSAFDVVRSNNLLFPLPKTAKFENI